MYFYLPIIIFLLLDQGIKILVRTTMTEGQSIPVISGIFHITYIENPGAAFGMLANQRLLFILITAVMLCILIYVYLHLPNRKSAASVSLALIVSGAIGNFIDRFLYGTVTDFLDFQIWPIFNIADICICCGVALLCYLLIFKGDSF